MDTFYTVSDCYAVCAHCCAETDSAEHYCGSRNPMRYLFGLPFALLYFLALKHFYQGADIVGNAVFYRAATLAAIAQIFATVFLVKALTLRNFAVGTALAKTEALLTAMLGAVFFSVALSSVAYISIFIGVSGILIAGNWKLSWVGGMVYRNESAGSRAGQNTRPG